MEKALIRRHTGCKRFSKEEAGNCRILRKTYIIPIKEKRNRMKERTEISMNLYHMLIKRGYPEPLCELITRNLNTDYTAARMIGYLSHYSYLPEGEIVDEMLSILSDRNDIMKKKEGEQTQAKLNDLYRYGLDIE